MDQMQDMFIASRLRRESLFQPKNGDSTPDFDGGTTPFLPPTTTTESPHDVKKNYKFPDPETGKEWGLFIMVFLFFVMLFCVACSYNEVLQGLRNRWRNCRLRRFLINRFPHWFPDEFPTVITLDQLQRLHGVDNPIPPREESDEGTTATSGIQQVFPCSSRENLLDANEDARDGEGRDAYPSISAEEQNLFAVTFEGPLNDPTVRCRVDRSKPQVSTQVEVYAVPHDDPEESKDEEKEDEQQANAQNGTIGSQDEQQAGPKDEEEAEPQVSAKGSQDQEASSQGSANAQDEQQAGPKDEEKAEPQVSAKGSQDQEASSQESANGSQDEQARPLEGAKDDEEQANPQDCAKDSLDDKLANPEDDEKASPGDEEQESAMDPQDTGDGAPKVDMKVEASDGQPPDNGRQDTTENGRPTDSQGMPVQSYGSAKKLQDKKEPKYVTSAGGKTFIVTVVEPEVDPSTENEKDED